jgi:hypothetical protein
LRQSGRRKLGRHTGTSGTHVETDVSHDHTHTLTHSPKSHTPPLRAQLVIKLGLGDECRWIHGFGKTQGGGVDMQKG